MEQSAVQTVAVGCVESALVDRDIARRERDVAIAECDAAKIERDNAIADREEAFRERAAYRNLVEALAKVEQERDAAKRELHIFQAEVARAMLR